MGVGWGGSCAVDECLVDCGGVAWKSKEAMQKDVSGALVSPEIWIISSPSLGRTSDMAAYISLG